MISMISTSAGDRCEALLGRGWMLQLSMSQSRVDRAGSVRHTKFLRVEVYDVTTWHKINVGIGRMFL